MLLELMIGISVLSLGLLTILDSFATAMVSIRLSEDCFRAGLLLEGNIYRLYNMEREEGVSEGTFKVCDDRFSWRTTVRRLEKDALDEINLIVFSNQRKSRCELAVLTYFR